MPASSPLIAVSFAPPRSQSSGGDSVVFATLPRGGSPALAQSAVELAQQGMQLRLLLRAERSEEHTSELQSHSDLVCRLLLEKKKKINHHIRCDETIETERY